MRSATKKRLQAVISFSFLFAVVFVGARLIALEDIEIAVRSAGIWAPLVLVAVKASTLIFAPLSGAPVYLAAGEIFPLREAFIYLFVGDFVGYSAAFFLARFSGRWILERLLVAEDLVRLDGLLGKIGTWKGLLVGRVVAIGFADFLNYGAGITRMPYLHYLLATVPVIIVSISVFLGIARFLIFDRWTFVAITAVVLLAPLFWGVIRRLIGRAPEGSVLKKLPLTLD